ncbi:uncharacterized protein LOC123892515 [Trifolium pratense]|uniref:uncharacterized protein LOC123892515 n=1 Tax=Trifolium pratense TaxID=57577 RepID=UPI001E6931CA|nr:uncharacterized protein LOC123892515 [Trifolium pratense]
MAAAATNTTQTETSVSLKLLLNEESNKVLFAEAGKDFVDILCSFLTIPLGTIARLVEKETSIGPVSIGCLNSLYKSVADLDQSCFCADTIKQMLLQPINFAEDYCNTLKLNIDDTQPTEYFACNNWQYYTSHTHTHIIHDFITSTNKDKYKCHCSGSFTSPVLPKCFHQGFVNYNATFIITDDLKVMPNSLDYASFGLLQEFGIKNPSSVKEIVLNISKEKVLDLLKFSLLSKSPLTDFFLGKKPSIDVSRFFTFDVTFSGNIQIILKLVIRKSDGKVLCAQGEQDFADLLLSFLTFPLGGINRIFDENFALGSIGGLYKSIAKLNVNKYLISKEAKNRLVDPCTAPQIKLSNHILPILEPGVIEYYRYYYGGNAYRQVQIFKFGEDKSFLGNCSEMKLSEYESNREAYLKNPTLYVATDDLVITPLSPISALGLLNRLKTPLNDLKEKVVTIGIKEVLNILKAGLSSTSALTNGLAHLLTEVKEEK